MLRTQPNIIITGTPGTGKSTHCEQLAEKTGMHHLSINDVVKKHNIGEASNDPDDPNLQIVDFSDEFAGHPEWLDAGGPHLTPAGQLAFAKLITDAVDEFHVDGS